jgi:hypothetical protein
VAKVGRILTKPSGALPRAATVATAVATAAARKLFSLAQPPAKVELPREPMRKVKK